MYSIRWRCTKNNIFFFQIFWKGGLSKKNSTGIWSFLYYQKKMIFLFPKNMILFFRRKMKDGLSQKKTNKKTWKYDIFCKCSEKMVFPKNSYWNISFFDYQERWYFYFLEMWSHYLSFCFQLICSNLLISLQITFSPNQICTGMCSSKCWWFYKDASH